jgi:hypothetical protein
VTVRPRRAARRAGTAPRARAGVARVAGAARMPRPLAAADIRSPSHELQYSTRGSRCDRGRQFARDVVRDIAPNDERPVTTGFRADESPDGKVVSDGSGSILLKNSRTGVFN